MGLKDDLERFRQVGDERRQDLLDFIQYGDMSASGEDDVRIPIKIIELPAFRYDFRDRGGVGQGEADVGDPLEIGEPATEDGQPGEEGGDHRFYRMDPEEFAQALDTELGLDLEPKGKNVIERVEGAYTDRARAGPESMLDVKHLFAEGLKRKLAMDFDEEYMREALKVDGIDVDIAFRWAREERIPVSRAWLEKTYADIPADQRDSWESITQLEAEYGRPTVVERIRRDGIDHVPFRREDERYRHPQIVEEYERNVVVVNIRDVSGSMRENKRELVERTFSPLDWYLQGKYDHAEFIYIVHDVEAWTVERREFFGIESAGGTRISAAYEVAANRLEAYPWSDWNRFIFAAGDSENAGADTRDRVIPLMESIEANRHAYVETNPHHGSTRGRHAEQIEEHFATDEDVVVSYVRQPADVVEAIKAILRPQVEVPA